MLCLFSLVKVFIDTLLGGLALRRQGEATGKRHINDERDNPGRSGVPYIG